MGNLDYRLSVVLWACLLTTSLSAQIQVDETYRLVPLSVTDKTLFPENAAMEHSTPIVMWEETHVPAEQWTVIGSGQFYAFKNVYSGWYLAPTSKSRGAAIIQNRSLTTSRWQLEAIDEEALIYRIRTTSGNLYLDASADTDGIQPKLAAADADSPGQLWQFIPIEASPKFSEEMRREMIDNYIDRFLQRIGSRRATFSKGSWGESEQLEVILDAYEATGDETYMSIADAIYKQFYQYVGSDWLKLVYTDDYHWFGHDFNDDVMWQIIGVARMGWLTGNESYINAAKKNFDRIYERAYIPFTGLMRWAEQSGDPYSTNSCIAGPTEVAACYLGMAGAGESYYEKARDLYAAQRYTLANITTGQVYDAVVWNPTTQSIKSSNKWASTYNQGTMLGAACMLYQHYGDQQYLDDACKIMNYTVKNLCNSSGIINVCQVNDGDLCGFKGILMRYVNRFVKELGQTEYADWIMKNAFHAYNNRSAKGVTTSAWLTKSTDETATNAFSCSTAAAAAAAVVFMDDDTGIREDLCRTTSARPTDTRCYDLTGRRITPTRHGKAKLVISNGRKSIVH